VFWEWAWCVQVLEQPQCMFKLQREKKCH
jgi:hypothetical protein